MAAHSSQETQPLPNFKLDSWKVTIPSSMINWRILLLLGETEKLKLPPSLQAAQRASH